MADATFVSINILIYDNTCTLTLIMFSLQVKIMTCLFVTRVARRKRNSMWCASLSLGLKTKDSVCVFIIKILLETGVRATIRKEMLREGVETSW